MRVKRNAKIFHTLIEHNGFHYPSEEFFSIDEELEVEELQWISILDKIPVIIKRGDTSVRVVWINKTDLL